MSRVIKVFLGSLCILIYFLSESFAGNIFEVSVTESIWGQNLVSSKKTAIAYAKKDAFLVLMNRMLLSRDVGKIINMFDDSLIQDVNINHEALEKNNYSANFMIRFFPWKVKNFLQEQNIRFAEIQGPKIALIMRCNNVLWCANIPQVFSHLVMNTYDLLPLFLIGTQESDKQFINNETLASGVALSYLQQHYHASGIIIVDIDSNNGASATFFGIWRHKKVFSNNVSTLIHKIRTLWKTDVLNDNKKHIFHVEIPIYSLLSWRHLKNKLHDITAIQEIHVSSLQIGAIRADIQFLGTETQFQLALAGQDINAQYNAENNYWILKELFCDQLEVSK